VDLSGVGESELALMTMQLWAGIVESEFADFTRPLDEKLGRSSLVNHLRVFHFFSRKWKSPPEKV
jgi:hypothetical protein